MNCTEQDLIRDIFEWDIENWSKCYPKFDAIIEQMSKGAKGLELGGRRGGLSLWMANQGIETICSDIDNPEHQAKLLHEKYNLQGKVQYEAIDALDIPYKEEFEIIMFKSILGSLSRNGQDASRKEAIAQMYKALKPGGYLLFSENLESSFLHRGLRKRFVKWGTEWNYLRYDQAPALFSQFSAFQYSTCGFLGAFGRLESQREFLGKIDGHLHKIIPSSQRYVLFGVARK